MIPQWFKYIYLAGLLGTYIVRLSGVAENVRSTQKSDILTAREKVKNEGILITLLMLLWFVASQIVPIIYAFSDAFAWAEIERPTWMGFLGMAVFAFALWLLWRAHFDLGRNWSSTVQIKIGQNLVTQGVYKYIRHPIYSAHILWGIAQALMLPNWFAGWGALLLIIPVFLIRIPNEEKTLLDRFGDAYLEYMKETGSVAPRIFRP